MKLENKQWVIVGIVLVVVLGFLLLGNIVSVGQAIQKVTLDKIQIGSSTTFEFSGVSYTLLTEGKDDFFAGSWRYEVCIANGSYQKNSGGLLHLTGSRRSILHIRPF